MKRTELKKVFRIMLLEQPALRHSLSRELPFNPHEITIKRWAKNNSPCLTDKAFLDCFKKHTKATVELTEDINITETHLAE
jgi:hypothetical protein